VIHYRTRSGRPALSRLSLTAGLLFLFGPPNFLAAKGSEKEKIAEGQYVRLKDNLRVQDSEQSWILWRLPDGGYELEDHFHLPILLICLPSLTGFTLAPQLHSARTSAVTQTDLVARYSPDWRLHALRILGKEPTGKTIDVLNCETDAKELRCRGLDSMENAKLRVRESAEFFYPFPFPMLVGTWFFKRANMPANSLPDAMAVLEYRGNLELSMATRSIETQKDEILTIGDRQLEAHKAKITLAHKDRKPLKLAIWYSTPGVVYASETEGISGERMALVQYKKYVDF
jgi:hypothetical protein